MEVNTNEKVFLSVDGTAKTFNSCAGHHHLGMSDGQTIQPPGVGHTGVSCKPSQILLQYKHSAQHLSGSGLKMSNIKTNGVIKTVRAQWRKQENKRAVRSSSTGNRHPASDRIHKTSSDPLPALAIPDQTCHAPLEDIRLTKPKNCRRVVVLGAPKVGKTNILRRFLNDDEFKEQYEPTAEDFFRKLYHIRGETYQTDILDAAGERDYPAKRRLSILTGDIFILAFSVDDRESFKEVCALRQEIIAAKTKLMKIKDPAKEILKRVPIVICGNKVDLEMERVVSRSEMYEALGEEAALFEASAKDGTGLEEMFGALAKLSGLPTETSPSQHELISIQTYQALSTSRRDRRVSRALGFEGPCGAVYPLACRPSFSCDLQNVLEPSATKRSKAIEKCQIQ